MNIVIWDIETDSSNTFFGTIIEIGAILINDNFQELDKLNIRCRLPEGVVPQAGALLVINQMYLCYKGKLFSLSNASRGRSYIQEMESCSIFGLFKYKFRR